ncbi:ribosome biogenesis factor YjgA [Pontibacter sp. JAM-7]|uniref:ribosome biogenesis factor YjgA n=1 Tax=Pontibacter sp. JAM-7 TaxID=3366581 RepID=UPI003AF6BDE3
MTEHDPFDKTQPDNDQELVSKTKLKQQMHELQALGTRLVELNAEQLAKLSLDDRLLQAIEEARRIKSNGAMKRHMQFIGKLLRAEDAEQIEQQMGVFEAGKQAHTQLFHKLERWRDRLINEGNDALQSYIDGNPEADVQHLRQLIRNAQKEQAQNKPPASARKLFKYLREVAGA